MAHQCGRGEYLPQAIPIPADGSVIDVDGTWPGDYFTCPKHPDQIVYVQGQNFWQDNDPTPEDQRGPGYYHGWSELTIGGHCTKCPGWGHNVHFTVGSYGG